MSETPIRWQRKAHSRDLTGLGWLEAEVMRIVLDQEPVTVRDVYEELRLRRKIAYTTVMSVLHNLAVKGLLNLDRGSSAYLYTPAVSDIEVAQSIPDALVEKLMGGRVEPLIDYLEEKRAAGAR